MGGSRLQEVVTHGGSTVQLLRIKALWKLNVEKRSLSKKVSKTHRLLPTSTTVFKGQSHFAH